MENNDDIHVKWSLKKETKRITIDYDNFHAMLAAGRMENYRTNFNVGEGIGITGKWIFFMSHNVSNKIVKTSNGQMKKSSHSFDGHIFLDTLSNNRSTPPFTVQVKISLIDGDKTLGCKTSHIITNPFSEFVLGDLLPLSTQVPFRANRPCDSALKLLYEEDKLPDRIKVVVELTVFSDEAVSTVV